MEIRRKEDGWFNVTVRFCLYHIFTTNEANFESSCTQTFSVALDATLTGVGFLLVFFPLTISISFTGNTWPWDGATLSVLIIMLFISTICVCIIDALIPSFVLPATPYYWQLYMCRACEHCLFIHIHYFFADNISVQSVRIRTIRVLRKNDRYPCVKWLTFWYSITTDTYVRCHPRWKAPFDCKIRQAQLLNSAPKRTLAHSCFKFYLIMARLEAWLSKY